MSKLNLRFRIFLTLSFLGYSLAAQTIVVSTQGNNLFEVNMEDCSYQQIGTVPMRTTDIGFHPNGNLYALTSVGELFLVDFSTGNFTRIYTFEMNPTQLYTALTIGGDGTFFACGDSGDLYIYRLDTNMGNFLGNVGFPAEGDLAFNNGELYMAAANDDIVRVNTTVPSASEVVIDGDVPNRLFGLVSSARSCQNLRTYAMTDQSAEVYLVDFVSGRLTPYCDIPLAVTGGASTFEFFGSAPVFLDSIQTRNFDCVEGDATVFARGGIDPLEYSADGVSFQASSTFLNLPASTDSLFVRDAVGCETGALLELDLDRPELEVRNAMQATCGEANGSFEILVRGGVGPYELTIDGQPVGRDTLFTGLEAGSYTVTATDSQGCTGELAGIVVSSQSIPIVDELVETDARCGDNNGSLTLTVVGGTPPYQYQVNNGALQDNNVFTDLPAGTYLLTVIDAASCRVEASAEIQAIAPVTIAIDSITGTTCAEANGAVTLSAVGEVPFTFALAGGSFQGDPVFTDLAGGDYLAVVRSANDCTDTTFVKIGTSEGVEFVAAPLIQPAACTLDNGGIDFDFQGDAFNYALTLNGQNIPAGTSSLRELAAGEYVLIATEEECTDTLRFRIPRERCPVYFANAFSPNRDGVNDQFAPQALLDLNVEVRRFEIFDRWGGQVHATGPGLLNDPSLAWNGRRQNRDLPAGIYVYFAEIVYEDGVAETFSGEVLLLR